MHLVKCFEPKTNLSCKYTKFAIYFFRRSPAKHKKKNAAIHKNITMNPLYTFGFVIDMPFDKIFRTFEFQIVTFLTEINEKSTKIDVIFDYIYRNSWNSERQ